MLVPELSVVSPDAATSVLRAFGFLSDGGLWRLGNQCVRVVPGAPGGHGRIDHIALAVPDIDSALAGLQAKGIRLDAGITPHGPELISEMWDGGLRFVYLTGPEAARIELCQRLAGAASAIGHDHIGIPCQDLAAMQSFFEVRGACQVASVDVARPEGVIPVRFLSFAGGTIELFQPSRADRAANGLWSRLLVQGLAGAVDGPEGLTLAPL